MKIILPVVDDKSSKNKVARGFHKSDYVCIYDSENNVYQWMKTSDLSANPGNLSIELKRKGIYAVISPYMHIMALGLFAESGLSVFKAKNEDVDQNINMFLSNNLESYTVQSALGLSGCSSSCSSCSISCN